MDITRLRALRGPNLWSRRTCIEAIVSCTGEHCSLDAMPGFAERLRALFPGIRPLRPTARSGPLAMADALELAALGLQASAGCPVTFSCTMQTVDNEPPSPPPVRLPTQVPRHLQQQDTAGRTTRRA